MPPRLHVLSRTRSLGTVVIVAAGLMVSCSEPAAVGGGAAAPVVDAARPLTCLDSALAHYADSGQGWTGGDSTWSAALSDGREVFAFSDTFLPPVTAPTRPSEAVFVHNSLVVRERDGRLSTLVGGSQDKPEAWLAPPDPSHWYWLGAVTVGDGALQVPVGEWRSVGPGAFDIEFVGSTLVRVAEHDLRQPVSMTPLPRTKAIQWGQWVQWEAPWTYVYGVETEGDDKHLHVARVAGTDLRQPLSFWTGTRWSDSEAESARVVDGVNSEVSVHRVSAGRYLLVTMAGDGLSDRMIGRYASTPTGPFGPATTLYITPETGASGSYRDPDIYTYNAHVHPEFSTATTLVISYNVNSFDTATDGDLYRDTGIYRPRFLTVTLSDSSAVASETATQPACL
ncbi:DUF4185 domain-containing protein [Nocardia callitridis]|uniref:DUF4185 domain-containing protein n=1 Tax=Nocardia callitridis TaxID=648753 RepID=A0ABP9KD56_9NOCA